MLKHVLPITVLCAVVLLAGPAGAKHIELTNRMVTLNGPIKSKVINKVVKTILDFDAQSHDPIWLMIDSFGGSVDAGFVLVDTIENIESPVYSVITSKAYSMAAMISVFCKKRYIFPHATMMFHEASYGALGEDPTIRSRMEFNVKYLDRIHAQIAQRIGMSLKKYRNKIRDAWWVLANGAVKAKFADAIVSQISYRKLDIETTEIKKTTTLKKKRTIRREPKQLLDATP